MTGLLDNQPALPVHARDYNPIAQHLLLMPTAGARSCNHVCRNQYAETEVSCIFVYGLVFRYKADTA
jgi:hypothetical protein